MADSGKLDVLIGRLDTLSKIIPQEDPTQKELAKIVKDLVILLNEKKAGF